MSESIVIESAGEACLEELYELCRPLLPYDQLSEKEFGKKIFRAPDYEEEFTLVARDGGRVAGCAVATTSTAKDGSKIGHLKLWAVSTRHRDMDLGGRLLDELESRCRKSGCVKMTTRANPPVFLWPGIDVRYTQAICLLQRRGYVRTGEALNLDVDLDGPAFSFEEEKARLAEHGIEIRRVRREEREAFERYMRAEWSPNWAAEALSALENDPPSLFVAVQGGEFRGFAANDTARPGWFGPMGTSKSMRGLGVGSALLKACLSDWQRQGRKYGEITWIGPLAFYAKTVGARIGRTFWFMEQDLVEPEPQAQEQ